MIIHKDHIFFYSIDILQSLATTCFLKCQYLLDLTLSKEQKCCWEGYEKTRILLQLDFAGGNITLQLDFAGGNIKWNSFLEKNDSSSKDKKQLPHDLVILFMGT